LLPLLFRTFLKVLLEQDAKPRVIVCSNCLPVPC